jgi:glucose/arabinose dehydrogenase
MDKHGTADIEKTLLRCRKRLITIKQSIYNVYPRSDIMVRMSIVSALLVSAIIIPVASYLQSSLSSSLSPLVYGQQQTENEFRQKEFVETERAPQVLDQSLKVEVVAEGLRLPTTMAFLGPDDIIVLEKENGTVRRIVNGELLPEPILDVNVAGWNERCMCGIAVSDENGSGNSSSGQTYVYLYYTESESADNEDITAGKTPLGNHVYRYELVENRLINPELILKLPAEPGPRHNGGAIMIGPDNNLYIPIGDVDGSHNEDRWETRAQNYVNATQPDGRGGILRITLDGEPVPGGSILGDDYPMNLYYAYGIRNSFGIDFDPITGNLWDSENGPGDGDEINFVEPGFNSGWQQIQGFPSVGNESGDPGGGFDPTSLETFDGRGKYSDPEFSWVSTIGPTAVNFFDSNKFGVQYQNGLFVADVRGLIYHFNLNDNRSRLLLEGPLADRMADNGEDPALENVTFARDFGGITDLEVGPYDGYLYVVSIGQGKIFRVLPSSSSS